MVRLKSATASTSCKIAVKDQCENTKTKTGRIYNCKSTNNNNI